MCSPWPAGCSAPPPSTPTDKESAVSFSVKPRSQETAVHFGQARHSAPKRAEAAQPAREHDDLLILPCATRRVEHALNTIVIAVNEGVVEDDLDRPASLGEHRSHGETDEHSNFLLRAVGQAVECLWSISLDASDGETVAEFEFDPGNKSLRNGRKWRRTGSW